MNRGKPLMGSIKLPVVYVEALRKRAQDRRSKPQPKAS
jgi:hypothetical protein